MSTDPCFRCTLPECDESKPGCLVRIGCLSYDKKRRSGQIETVTPDERAARNSWYLAYKLERLAQAAEGIRPFNQADSAWRGGPAPASLLTGRD